MISLDTILYKIEKLIQDDRLDDALLTLENSIDDDLVNTSDEKELSVKYLQLLLLRKTPNDLLEFEEWCKENSKAETYDKRMTELIFSYVSYKLTYTEFSYTDEEFKIYENLLNFDKYSPFTILLNLNKISFFEQEPRKRYDAQLVIFNDAKENSTTEEWEFITNYFKDLRLTIQSKTSINSDDSRLLEILYIVEI